MSKCITIGSCTFKYPTQTQCAGWGEVAADTMEAVADQLAIVTAPTDIPLTTVDFLNNQCSSINVGSGATLLRFANTAVRSFTVTYSIRRVGSCETIAETGKMHGINDGCCSWTFSYEHTGCAGVCFTITCTGQIQYTSTCLTGQTTGKIKFRARTTPVS